MVGGSPRGDARSVYTGPLRRVYRAIGRSRLGRVVEWPPVQGLRNVLRPQMGRGDVLNILDALSRAGVTAHVMGGWGVDALVGRQTRRHTDLDVVCAAADGEQASRVLAALGYALSDEEPTFVVECGIPDRRYHTDRAGRAVDVHLLGPATRVTAEPLLATGRIGDRTVGCLSAPAQLELHEGYEPYDTDRRDVALLCETFGLTAPASYA